MNRFLFALLVLWPLLIQAQVVVPLTWKGDVYRVPCQVNGVPLEFIVDTGASDVSISSTEARFMLKNGYLNTDDILSKASYSLANGSIVTGTLIRLHTVQIGSLVLHNVQATVINNANAPLLLGQSVLKRLGHLAIDYKNNTLTITKDIAPDLFRKSSGEQLFTKPGVISNNDNLYKIPGWTVAERPEVKDDSDEEGTVEFQLSVTDDGDIYDVIMLSTTLSPAVTEAYRQATKHIRLRPTNGQLPPHKSTGKVRYIVSMK